MAVLRGLVVAILKVTFGAEWRPCNSRSNQPIAACWNSWINWPPLFSSFFSLHWRVSYEDLVDTVAQLQSSRLFWKSSSLEIEQRSICGELKIPWFKSRLGDSSISATFEQLFTRLRAPCHRFLNFMSSDETTASFFTEHPNEEGSQQANMMMTCT